MTVGALATARAFHRRFEQNLSTAYDPDAMAAVRTVLDGVAGPDQVVDPRLRALYL
jgi:hypothetical protein